MSTWVICYALDGMHPANWTFYTLVFQPAVSEWFDALNPSDIIRSYHIHPFESDRFLMELNYACFTC